MTLTAAFWAAALLSTANINLVAAESTAKAAGVLFGETFDDARLTERGWYDGRTFAISREGTRAGGGCIEYRWKPGTTTPERSSGLRRLFEPTDTVYLRFYIKLSPGWGWTGRSYHPHLMHFLTTENDKYHGPAASHLTVYIEPQEGKLRLAAQDIQNQDMPHGLTQGPLRGGYNGTFYDSKDVLFTDDEWHCVEAMFQLNSLDPDRDRPNADGIVRGWFDGKLVVDRTDVVLRSTDFPNMKFNQFLLAPYFGPGLLPARADPVDRRAGRRDRAAGRSRKRSRAGPSARLRRRRSMRIAAAQPRNRTIDFRLKPAEVLAEVDRSLGGPRATRPQGRRGRLRRPGAPRGHARPAQVGVGQPGGAGRGAPRGGHADARPARQGGGGAPHVPGPLQRRHRAGRPAYNTAFLLGRDGKEIGRYHKVNLPLAEQSRARGRRFPVFPTPDLGTVGMLICYDMVFPEAARCLALGGADVVFHPTLGGAAFGDDDISLAAFRTRAVENFVYLVVAMRGHGSMIISPQGKVLATAKEPDGAGHRRHRPVRRPRGRRRLQHPGATCAAGSSASGCRRPTASSPIPTRPCSPRSRRT